MNSVATQTRTNGARKSNYNPRQVCRHVRTEGVTPDGIMLTSVRSMTRTNEQGAETHAQSIDLQTGEMSCTCPHFVHRLAKFNPTFDRPLHICKHLEKALLNMARKGEVEIASENGRIEAVRATGYSFNVPMAVAPGANSYDALHDAYLDDLAERYEATHRAYWDA